MTDADRLAQVEAQSMNLLTHLEWCEKRFLWYAEELKQREADLAALRSALSALREKFVDYRDADMKGNKTEVQTIRRTLNVVVSELDALLTGDAQP